MYFFQIGPNKCGTTSLFRMFAKSDIPSLKYTGQKKGHVCDGAPLTFNA